MKMDRLTLMKRLIEIHFERTNADLHPGSFRSIGSRVDLCQSQKLLCIKLKCRME